MRRHLWVLAAYVGLSLLLTWPLAGHFAGHVPGDGIDDPSLAWNLWWIKHSLVDQPQNPFACRWMFWPVGINLAFYTLTILNGLLGIPLQLTFGLVPTYNLLLLSSYVFSGYGAFLLCRDFLGRLRFGRRDTREDAGLAVSRGARPASPLTADLAAFAGGALYAFASAKMFYAALGQANIASSQWVPFAALYILRTLRPRGRAMDAILAALFLVFEAYAEQTYASFLLIFAVLAACWAVVRLVSDPRPRQRTAYLRAAAPRLVLMGLLVLAGLLPFLLNMLPDLAAEGDFFSSGGGFADVFSADLAGYALPTQLHPLFGTLTRRLAGGFPIDKGQQIYLGYTVLVLVVIGMVAWGARTRPRIGRAAAPGAWFWGAVALCFFLLTLGPTLRVAGHDTGIPLPFTLVAQLPFFKGNRYPSRYSVMLLMSVAPLVSLGTLRVLGTARSFAPGGLAAPWPWGRFAVLLGLLLFEHLSAPLPLSDLRVPALYGRVAATPGDFSLLELPLGWRNGARVAGKQDLVIMQEQWYQTVHGKRLLGGNTSRNPEFKFQYFSEDPTLARLIALSNAADVPQHTALRAALANEEISAGDRERAADWAAFLNVRYVMVHRDKLPRDAEDLLRALFPVHLVGEDGPLALYELDTGSPAWKQLDLATAEGRMALAEGWSPPAQEPPARQGEEGAVVWAERRETKLLLPLGQDATRLRVYGWAVAPGQTLAVTIDGRPAGVQALSQEPGWLSFAIPSMTGRPPLSDVRLRFGALAPVPAVAGDPWPNGPAGIASPVSLLVRSAGEETGDFAHIYVNGVDVAPNERGYNLVALDGHSGQLLAAASFDTFGDRRAGADLAAWVRGLPAGALVAGAVRDEASLLLSPEAVSALRTLGVSGDLRDHFRWSHAFIGLVGAAPGTALESLTGWLPAQVSVGLPVSAPALAGAIARIGLERQ